MEKNLEDEVKFDANLTYKRVKVKAVGKKKIRYFNSSKSVERTLHRSRRRISSSVVIAGLRANNRALARMVQETKAEIRIYHEQCLDNAKEKHDLHLRVCQLEQQLGNIEQSFQDEYKQKFDLLKITLNKVVGNMCDTTILLKDAVNMCSFGIEEDKNSINSSLNVNKNVDCASENRKIVTNESESPETNNMDNFAARDKSSLSTDKKTIYDLTIINESPELTQNQRGQSRSRKSSRSHSFSSEETQTILSKQNISLPDNEPVTNEVNKTTPCFILCKNNYASENLILRNTELVENEDIIYSPKIIINKAKIQNQIRRATFVIANSKQTAPWPDNQIIQNEDCNRSPDSVHQASPRHTFVSVRMPRSKSSSRPPSKRSSSLELKENFQSSNESPALNQCQLTTNLKKTDETNETKLFLQDMELTSVVDRTIVAESSKNEKKIDEVKFDSAEADLETVETKKNNPVDENCFKDRNGRKSRKEELNLKNFNNEIDEIDNFNAEKNKRKTSKTKKAKKSSNIKIVENNENEIFHVNETEDKEEKTKRKHEEEKENKCVVDSTSNDDIEHNMKRGRSRIHVNYKLPPCNRKMRNTTEVELFKRRTKKQKVKI